MIHQVPCNVYNTILKGDKIMEEKESQKVWHRKSIEVFLEFEEVGKKEDAFRKFHRFLIKKNIHPGEIIILKKGTIHYTDDSEKTEIDFLYWA